MQIDFKLQKDALKQSGLLNDLSVQSALPLLDNFSYVSDTDEREHWIGKSLKMD